jgi:hypothetical protein
MKKLMNLVAGPVAAALLCVASVSPSYAQATAFVSGGGSGSVCTLAQPCRSIAIALALIAGNGGTVSCLDAGPYSEAFSGSISYTLDCRGVVYTSPSGFAFSLGSGSPNPLVTFRHVIFDGAQGGAGAVTIASGKVVFEDCTFQNYTAGSGEAVQFEPTVAGAQLTITDSVFAHNGTASGGGGIYIEPSAGITAGAVIERTQVTGNTYGIVANGFASGTVLAEVRYSTIANSVFDGIWAVTQGTTASVVVEHSATIRNGGSGANAQGSNAYVSFSDSTIAWNATGLTTSGGGTNITYKNNVIGGNPNPGVTPYGLNLQ